jgi:acetyltransferase
MWQRKRWLDIQALGEEPVLHLPGCMPDRAVEAISMKGSDGWLPPEAIDILLGAYCISVPGSGLADSPDEAVRLAGIMGYPVVLKLAAEGLTHKTDIGGVIVGLKNDLEVRSAFTDLMDHAAASLNPTQIKGVLVQQMVCGGRELIVGAVRDPQFGPLVMAGTGGTQVELVHDVAFDLAPLSHSAASTLFDQTAAGKLLAGFRGTEPADREAAVDVLLRLASIMVEHPQVIEIEINPLLVLSHGEGAFAVDTRVRIGS